MQVIPLRYGVAFKKAFGDPVVFSAFASDVLGMSVQVDTVDKEYSFTEPVGRVKVEYDLFAEDTTHRLIIEVQHVREQDFFDRFLHYHLVALVEQAESHEQYRMQREVYTLVVLTTAPRDKELRFSVATMTMDPVTEQGEGLGVFKHRMVFLNPRVINDRTPPGIRKWMELIADSLDGQVDEARYADPIRQRVLSSIRKGTESPEELARIKDEAAWEETKATARKEGRDEGRAEEQRSGVLRRFERRLGRSLAEGERAAVLSRLASLGAERLDDLVLGADAEALAAWLAGDETR